MFDKLPKLEASIVDTFREVLALPLWFFAVLIQGETCLWIDKDRNIHFKKAKRIEDPVEGIVVDGEFVPSDGPGSYCNLWNTRFWIGFEDLRTLLNPATMEVDEDDVADVEVNALEVVVTGSGRSIRSILAFPFWFTASLVQGSTAFHIDENRNLTIKRARSVSEPYDGIVVGDEFKRAKGPGCYFQRWGNRMVFARANMEGLWNPATSEMLRASSQAEQEGAPIGADADENTGVICRATTAVNVGRLNDYAPFAMLDGTSTRKQMNTAYAAREKYQDGSTLGKIVAILTAFMLGAMSPRFNGTSGGGGGGGVNLPMPTITPAVDVSHVQPAIDTIATAGVF